MNYKVVWKKGVSNPADYLSRHAMKFNKIPKSWQEEADDLEHVVWFAQYGPYVESISDAAILEASLKDSTLKKLKKAIHKGYISKGDQKLAQYRQVLNLLSVFDDGLVLKDGKIVLPKAL